MGLLNWLGIETRADDTPPEQPPQGSGVMPPRRDITEVTENTALSLVSVYRGVSILTTAASQLTLDTWRGTEPIDAPLIARRPHVDQPLSVWLSEIVSSLALTGNAYIRVERNERGEARNLTILNPHEAHPQENGTLAWRGTTLTRSQFQHLKLLPRAGQLLGLGPIQAARAELGGALELRNYAAGWFNSGDVPSGILSTEQALTAETAAEAKARWEERDAHSVAVLGQGLSYQPILLKPEDAQWIEARQFSTTEIARLFGIPSHMLLAAVEGNSMTYTNLAQADLSFARWTLMQYLKPIEDAMTEVLPRGTISRFNIDGLIRPDIATRYEAHKVGLEAGFLTTAEVRAIEGLPPLPASPPLLEGITHD